MTKTSASRPRYCSECGTQLLPDAQFCHSCGAPVGGAGAGAQARYQVPATLRWGVPAAAIAALALVVLFRGAVKDAVPPPANASPTGPAGMAGAPDITAMSPAERADRLFNRVMEYSSAGKNDSAVFFAPMALAAFEALEPRNAHLRYDMGLIALVAGDLGRASEESAAILKERPNHLLGLSLAARVADARGDSAAARSSRQKLLAAESTERAAQLPEYTDHAADVTAALEAARSR